MRLSRLGLVAFWVLASSFSLPLNAQSDFDGDFWRPKVRDLKVIYVVGFVDGRNFGVNQAAGAFQTTVLDPRLSSLASRVTVGQIVEGLDEFYKDWRNTRIRIRDAIEYVLMEAKGKDGRELLRFLRKDAASIHEE